MPTAFSYRYVVQSLRRSGIAAPPAPVDPPPPINPPASDTGNLTWPASTEISWPGAVQITWPGL